MKSPSMTGWKASTPEGGATIFACANAAGNKVPSGIPLRQANSASASPLQLRDRATLAVTLDGVPADQSPTVLNPESMLRSVSQTP